MFTCGLWSQRRTLSHVTPWKYSKYLRRIRNARHLTFVSTLVPTPGWKLVGVHFLLRFIRPISRSESLHWRRIRIWLATETKEPRNRWIKIRTRCIVYFSYVRTRNHKDRETEWRLQSPAIHHPPSIAASLSDLCAAVFDDVSTWYCCSQVSLSMIVSPET